MVDRLLPLSTVGQQEEMSRAMVEHDLETRVALLERRVHELEGRRPVARFSPPPLPAAPAPAPARSLAPPRPPAPRPAPRRDARQLEELLGGRVLAWVGALAVVVGLFLLLVIAISN